MLRKGASWVRTGYAILLLGNRHCPSSVARWHVSPTATSFCWLRILALARTWRRVCASACDQLVISAIDRKQPKQILWVSRLHCLMQGDAMVSADPFINPMAWRCLTFLLDHFIMVGKVGKRLSLFYCPCYFATNSASSLCCCSSA